MRVLCRRTTPDDFGRNRWADISIPVLRVEDDRAVSMSGLAMMNFNPRPPCGGRLTVLKTLRAAGVISIHVLRVEDDRAALHAK